MFEKSFIEMLSADVDLVSLLSVWEAKPAIFSESAPQDAVTPYVVFDIRKNSDENLAVSAFTIDIDIYDDSSSGVVMRNIAERIEFVTDTKAIIGDDRFNTIRLYYDNGNSVDDPDIKTRHYSMQISARGGRKKWIDETIA